MKAPLERLPASQLCGFWLLFYSMMLPTWAVSQAGIPPFTPDSKIPTEVYYWQSDLMKSGTLAIFSPPPEYTGILVSNNTHDVIHVVIVKSDTSEDVVLRGDIAAQSANRSKEKACYTPEIRTVLPRAKYTVRISTEDYTAPPFDIDGEKGFGHSIHLGRVMPGCVWVDEGNVRREPTQLQLPTAGSISVQIDRIAKGAHQELPAPARTSATPGQNPGWSIENSTGYQVHLYLSAPLSEII